MLTLGPHSLLSVNLIYIIFNIISRTYEINKITRTVEEYKTWVFFSDTSDKNNASQFFIWLLAVIRRFETLQVYYSVHRDVELTGKHLLGKLTGKMVVKFSNNW